MGPPVYMFSGENITSLTINGVTSNFLAVKIDATGIEMKNNLDNRKGRYPLGTLPMVILNLAPAQLNDYLNGVSMYALQHLNLKVAGRKIPVSAILLKDDAFRLYFCNKAYCNFGNGIFLVGITSAYAEDTLILDYVSDLPAFINKYQQYIAANKNTRDTSLTIAKNNAIKDTAFGAVGGILGLAGASGGLDTAKSLFSTAKGFTNTIMGYQNKKKMMTAELMDKKASIKNEIVGGATEDTKIATYILSRDNTDL